MDVREKLVELLGRCAVEESITIEPVAENRLVDFLANHGVTVQDWVTVTDRLPDWRDGKVLVFTKYGFSICERTVNNRWRGQHANWITHWTYLPQPPKGE